MSSPRKIVHLHRDHTKRGPITPVVGGIAAMESRTQDLTTAYPTILIVDDHAKIRDALHDWLRIVFPSCLCQKAASGEEALTLASRQQPDVVLMDIGLPGIDGLEATRRLKKLVPDVPVVIITIHEDVEYRTSAQAAGASAYIPKHRIGTELIPVLQQLLSPSGDASLIQ